MYTLIYYVTETKGTEVIEREYHYSNEYRLRRNALHYLREIVQNDYREEGYATSLIAGGLYCIKSEKTDKGERKTTEIRVKVEKVK
jgi:hypothetical protein